MESIIDADSPLAEYLEGERDLFESLLLAAWPSPKHAAAAHTGSRVAFKVVNTKCRRRQGRGRTTIISADLSREDTVVRSQRPT